MGLFKKTQVQQSQMRKPQSQQPQKQLQYVKGNYPGAAPFFFENGNIYYIYNDCLVGTYEIEDKDEIMVFDKKGRILGKVEKDGAQCADASLWNMENRYSNKAKEYEGTDVEKKLYKLGRIDYFKRNQAGKTTLMSYVAKTYGYSVEDYNNHNLKHATCESYQKDCVGIMAAFICMQAVDPRAPFHSFYTID